MINHNFVDPLVRDYRKADIPLLDLLSAPYPSPVGFPSLWLNTSLSSISRHAKRADEPEIVASSTL